MGESEGKKNALVPRQDPLGKDPLSDFLGNMWKYDDSTITTKNYGKSIDDLQTSKESQGPTGSIPALLTNNEGIAFYSV